MSIQALPRAFRQHWYFILQHVLAMLAGAPEPAPAAPPRLELAEGGALEVPEGALRDAEKRRRIAESPEALARWLRATENDGG